MSRNFMLDGSLRLLGPAVGSLEFSTCCICLNDLLTPRAKFSKSESESESLIFKNLFVCLSSKHEPSMPLN